MNICCAPSRIASHSTRDEQCSIVIGAIIFRRKLLAEMSQTFTEVNEIFQIR